MGERLRDRLSRPVEGLSGRRRARRRLGRVVPRARARAAGALAGRARRDPRRAPGDAAGRAGAVLGVLDDLDRVLAARVSRTGRARASSPTSRRRAPSRAILAELLAAGLNQVGILWRTSPALQELEELTLDWLRQLRRPSGRVRTATSRTRPRRDRSPRSSLRAPLTPDRRVLRRARSTRTPSVDKAARSARARAAAGPDRRGRSGCAPTLMELEDACAVSRRSARPGRRPSTRSPRSPSGASRRHVAPRRRGLRRSGGDAVPSCATTSPAGSAPTRSVSTRTSGSASRRTAPRSGRGARMPSATPSASSPSSCASPDDVANLSEYSHPARPALPGAQAVGGAALLRAVGLAGAHPRARPPRGAVRGAGCATSRVGRSSLRGPSRSSASAATAPTRTERAAPRACQR